MSRFESQLKKILSQNGQGIVSEIQNELKDQGHYNSGKLYKSTKSSISQTSEGFNLDVEMLDYQTYVEHGVKAGRIPFGGKRSSAKTSKYIQGLISFFRTKGLSNKEARGAAFATAHKHKMEGMPTKSSYRFSSNGRRLSFINESTKASKQIENTGDQILNLLESEGNQILDHFEKSIK